MKIEDFCRILSDIAPLKLAEQWDNVGLLLGDRSAIARNVMTCLTITPAVVREAETQRVNLIVVHHPFPFKPVNQITADSASGAMLWRLARADVALYSAHTAHDSAAEGINHQWAVGLGLRDVKPILPNADDPAVGSGRIGILETPRTANEILEAAAAFCHSTGPRMAGDPEQTVRRIAVACGSGGSFIAAAVRNGCDFLLTGEATFHSCLEAENAGIAMGLVGHYASERFAMQTLARQLQAATQPGIDCQVWASRNEQDCVTRHVSRSDRS